jgi:alkylated DNA repair dioxygenase AlkB
MEKSNNNIVPPNVPLHSFSFDPSLQIFTTNPSVIPAIKGISYIPCFLSTTEQQRVIDIVNANPFAKVIHRRQQFYGETYYHTTPNISALQPVENENVTLQNENDILPNDNNALQNENDILPNENNALQNENNTLKCTTKNSRKSTVNQSSSPKELKCELQSVQRGWSNKNPPVPLPISLFSFLIDKLVHHGVFPLHSPPTQIMVNEYRGATGISNHVDDWNAFGDTVVTLSLVNPIWMNLQKNNEKINENNNEKINENNNEKINENNNEKINEKNYNQTKVLLEPGSILVLKNDARFHWKHGIPSAKWLHLKDGSLVKRTESYVRLSLTFRVLLDGRKKVYKEQ